MLSSCATGGNRPRISVALCTYNGAAFLRQQLDSISQQTRLPDEVIVRDDCSTDDTMRIVEQWSLEVPFPVHAEVNAENLGVSRNFCRAIEAATGDLIVLSDQDDVWLPQKLARLTQFLADQPATEAVFTDGWLVDPALNRLQLLSTNRNFRGQEIQQDIAQGRIVDTLASRALATGATMALRPSLRATLLPPPDFVPGGVIHDGWIALVAAVRGTLGFLDEPLILYRQHEAQMLGLLGTHGPSRPGRRHGAERAYILGYSAADAVLISDALHARFPGQTACIRPFDERRRHLTTRRDLPAARRRRAGPILRELLAGRYHRFGRGFKTALGDWLS